MTEIYDVSREIFLLREIFNSILICSLIIFGIYLFYRMRGKEKGTAQRNVYLGYCLFLFFYSMIRVCFILSDFEIYNSHMTDTTLNTIYVGLAYSFTFIAVFCIFIMIEKYLVHTRYIFSVLAVAVLGLSIVSIFDIITIEIPQLIMVICAPIFFAVIVLLYLYVAIKSSGEPRRRALGIMAGIFVMVIGVLFNSKLLGGALESIGLPFEVRILVEPFIIILGGAIFTFSQR